MFGKLGTWWDHRPLWQKIGLGAVAAVAAAAGGGALLGGGAASGGAAGGGAAAAGEAGAAGAATLGAEAGAAGSLGGVGLSAEALKDIAGPSMMEGFKATLAAHPSIVRYGKMGGKYGVNMYQDMNAKRAAQAEQRRQMAQYLTQLQGPAFPQQMDGQRPGPQFDPRMMGGAQGRMGANPMGGPSPFYPASPQMEAPPWQ